MSIIEDPELIKVTHQRDNNSIKLNGWVYESNEQLMNYLLLRSCIVLDEHGLLTRKKNMSLLEWYESNKDIVLSEVHREAHEHKQADKELPSLLRVILTATL